MEFSVNQIAAMANGVVEGDGEVKINTIAKIEEGHPGAISFLANPKYTQFIYTTGSSAVLVSKDFVAEQPVSATLIRVDDPYATVAHLLTMVQQMMTPDLKGIEQPSFVAEGVTVDPDSYIGAFAYVGRGVKLGRGVTIYPQAYVGDNCTIGDGTILYSGVKVYHGCKIGANCIIHSGAVIGADGFGFAPTEHGYDKIPQIGNVEIGANTTVDRAMMGSTRIEEGVKLDNLIQIAHNCKVGQHTVMASQAGVAGSTKVGQWCMIGGQVGLAGHIKIGDRVEIAAQSGLHKDAESGSRLFGSPAMDLKAYGRQAVSIKRIPDLIKSVNEIEKKLNEK